MATFDPHPNLQDLIRLSHEREATRPVGTSIRVFRSANLKTTSWRADVRLARPARTVQFANGRIAHFTSRESERCRALAETGEQHGLDRVGLIVETTSERWQP